MEPQGLSTGELLYEAEIEFDEVIEYGVTMGAISSGQVPIPAEGARFDQAFQGNLRGPQISGTIRGTDYLYVRADGRFQLHLHGRITTDDGVNISFHSEGISIQEESGNEAHLRSVVSLFSSSPKYAWVNKANVWAIGVIDLQTGQATIAAYQV